jgi:predicted alpha/beta hydrolase family esterase
MHVLIVAGVGGSGEGHWQTWLEQQLAQLDPKRVSRVQQDWQRPVFALWRDRVIEAIAALEDRVLLVAHSFGCLVSAGVLLKAPELADKIAGVLMVAPANPQRFSLSGEQGFCQYGEEHLVDTLNHPMPPQVPIMLWASHNDPWLSLAQAKFWAKAWGASLHNLGDVGHVNITSGFGAWPTVLTQVRMWPLPFFVMHQRKRHQKSRQHRSA